jgi:hypothetical protein
MLLPPFKPFAPPVGVATYSLRTTALNYLLHKNYKLYRYHIRLILMRKSESLYVAPMRVIPSFVDSQR